MVQHKKPKELKMNIRYSISTNHYNKYMLKETSKIPVLLQDLATRCMSPVTSYNDKEMSDVATGKEWVSKHHRNNANILERGNLGMIDFEGKKEKLDKLLQAIESHDLWYAAIPSQSNKTDKKNSRYHIVYLLTEPYSINAEAYKVQAKAFFEHIKYTWDDPDSGIDTRASFNACGYFAPTMQLAADKGKGGKKIAEPYVTLDDVAKDTLVSNRGGKYKPTAPDSVAANEAFTSVIKRGRRVKDAEFKIVRTSTKGYVLSDDSYIETSAGKFMTFEKLTEGLLNIEGENPRISMLGCPICNEGHTAASTIGYAYMQFDSNEKPYIYCTGNACSQRPFFTMADGNITVHRVDNAEGVSKYVMFENGQIIYTHERDMTYKLSPEAVSDELYLRGQGEVDEHGFYSRAITINKYVVGAESIQINHNPFIDEGLNIYDKTFTISPVSRLDPVEEDADEVITEAVKAFEDDAIICGYPVSLVYISYYLFHHKQIMPVLALVNPDRGSGKSFWVLDLPTWYLGFAKVSAMGSSAITQGWADEKLGKRIVVYEDIEHLNRKELGTLKSELKSDATAGDSKMLNIKGGGKKRSFGFNTAITSNAYDQIPFDGSGDRRIYPAPYKMLSNSSWLSNKLRDGSPTMVKHRTNAINFLYKIYKHCVKSNSQELHDALHYRVPQSKIRSLVEDSTSTDGYTAMNVIKRAKTKRDIVKHLSPIIASDVDLDSVKDMVDSIELTDDSVKVPGTVLKELWDMLPSGKNSMKSLNYRSLLSIFGIESQLKSVRINGKSVKGVEVHR